MSRIRKRYARPFLRWPVALFVLSYWVSGPLYAASEYEVKAAFIYNFIRFTDWPAESYKDNTLHLCILGRDFFREAIDPLQGRSVQNRFIRIRRVLSTADTQDCNILYVSPSESSRFSAVLGALGSRPILTLSDSETFAEKGGMIELALVDDRVQFSINLYAVRGHGLRINSQVLKLANRLIDGKGVP
jgi:YfiR/HmsC-like